MWTLFYRRFGDLAVHGNFERCLRAMLAYKHVSFLDPDVGQLRQRFHGGEPTYARLFALIQEQSAQRAGKPRWGDQTGLIEGYADDVLAAYPDAVMLHMIRDPRDRYDASLTMWPEGRLRVGGAVARWRYSARHARRNAAKHRGRYRVVRYEDLVTLPETTVRGVCEFVGEDYHSDMLEMRGMPSYREKLLADRTEVAGGPLISSRYVGSHHGRIPTRELTFLERTAARLMSAFGYEPHADTLVGSERIRYALVDAPLNVGRLAIWTVRQEAARRFPRLLGRKPPRHHRFADDS
jgi:hypothetical protein